MSDASGGRRARLGWGEFFRIVNSPGLLLIYVTAQRCIEKWEWQCERFFEADTQSTGRRQRWKILSVLYALKAN